MMYERRSAPGILTYLEKWIPISVLIGIFCGFGAIVLYKFLELCVHFFLWELAGYHPPAPAGEGSTKVIFSNKALLIPLVTTLGGLISGVIVYKLAPEAEGDGTEAAINVFHNKGGYVRPQVPLVKLVTSSITIGSGGSAGREGPIAQIGAGCGSLISRLLKLNAHDRRIAVAAGVGAGMGAIFRAPLGGAILAAEILYLADFEVEALIPAFIASVIAYSIFASIVGWSPIFLCPEESIFLDPVMLLLSAILGIMCGLYGILYAKTFYYVSEKFHELPIPRYAKPALGGLLVGIMGIFMPQILGTGYGWLQLLILGDFSDIGAPYISSSSPPPMYMLILILTILPLAKILATALTVGSGGSGGVFAPALVIGGCVGALLWAICKCLYPDLNISLPVFVVIGMMAFFGGVGKVPIAVILMVSEMTGTYTLLAPSMIATVLAYVITGKNTIFPSQVRSRADSPAHRGEFYIPLLRTILVEDVMTREVITIEPEASLSKAAGIMSQKGIKGLPVVDRNENLVGIVTLMDVLKVPAEVRSEVQVKEVMSRRLIVTYPKETLFDAFDKMVKNNIGRLPVVDPQTNKLVGIITRGDIRRAYSDRLFEMLSEWTSTESVDFLS